MPRKKISINPQLPFHITTRTVNRNVYPIPLEDVWSIYSDYLYFAYIAYEVKIHSFVLMPNHFHLIASFPKLNMPFAMNYFMGETSRRISEKAGRINQLYGGRFHRTQIGSERYFRHAYKYIYRNPVKANICNKVEEYPFSSLHALIGKSPASFPIEEDTILFRNHFRPEILNWLNTIPLEKDDENIRKALRRAVFELPKDKNTKAPNELEYKEF